MGGGIKYLEEEMGIFAKISDQGKMKKKKPTKKNHQQQ